MPRDTSALIARNKSQENRDKVARALRGRKKSYRCGPVAGDPVARIAKKFMPVPWTGCWLWLARLDPDGYGVFFLNKKSRRAHRVMYEMVNGAIPDGLQIDHLCRVRCCINPDHLEPVTCRENLARGIAGHRTHCKRGHAFDEVNTVRVPHGRQCRTCRNTLSLARYHRLKDA